MMNMARLLLATTLALSVAGPSFADGKKGRQPFVARPVPPLHVPAQPAPLPPPPIPFQVEPTSQSITLPPDFGTGGVGFDVDGGFVGGSRSTASADASASASSVSLSYTIVSPPPRSRGHGHGHGGGGGGGGDCGCE